MSAKSEARRLRRKLKYRMVYMNIESNKEGIIVFDPMFKLMSFKKYRSVSTKEDNQRWKNVLETTRED